MSVTRGLYEDCQQALRQRLDDLNKAHEEIERLRLFNRQLSAENSASVVVILSQRDEMDGINGMRPQLQNAQARIRRLEDQLVSAREALEPFATGETNVSYIPFEHFKTAARVWRQLTACDHDWQTTSEAPVVLYQTCSKCGETRRVEKAGDDGTR